MKKRHNKKLINTIKVIRDNRDCSPLLKYFNGRWILLAKYLDWLVDTGYITPHIPVYITDKAIKLLLRTNAK